jgi:hypothetical protein
VQTRSTLALAPISSSFQVVFLMILALDMSASVVLR